MPCYEVNTYSVEFEAKNHNLLLETIKGLGWRVVRDSEEALILQTKGYDTVTISNGQATSSSAKAVNQLRVAYSKTVVSVAKQWAQAKGWQVQQKSENILTLKR